MTINNSFVAFYLLNVNKQKFHQSDKETNLNTTNEQINRPTDITIAVCVSAIVYFYTLFFFSII